MLVTLTQTGVDEYSADKTFEEVSNAIRNGKVVVFKGVGSAYNHGFAGLVSLPNGSRVIAQIFNASISNGAVSSISAWNISYTADGITVSYGWSSLE